MMKVLSILLSYAVLASDPTAQKPSSSPSSRSVTASASASCASAEAPVVRDPYRPSCFRFYCDPKENKESVLGCAPEGQSPQLVRIPERANGSASDLFLIGLAQLRLEPIKCITKASEILARCKPQSAVLTRPQRKDSCANILCAKGDKSLIVKVCPPTPRGSNDAHVNVDMDQQKMPEDDQWSGLEVCFTNVSDPTDEVCLDPQRDKHRKLSFPWCVVP